MKFEPKTDQELAKLDEANLLPAGVYDFEVYSAEDTVSSKGNDMAVVKLRIPTSNGEDKIVTDYLVSTDGMAFKIKHFAETTGLINEYQSGELVAEMMKDRTGKAKIVITPPKGEYRAKNTVADYIKPLDVETNAAVQKARAEELNDDIPF